MAGKKILIVDDEKDLLHTMNVLLRANGYEVVAAADGLSAVSTAKDEKPDLILLDIGLPAGDGFDVIKRIANLTPIALTPIIVVTAAEASTNKERILEAGARAFFQKPIDSAELLAAIQEILETPVDASKIVEIG